MKLNIIKIGGNIIDNAEALQQFLLEFVQIAEPKILVHGGGKIATELGEKLGIVSQMVEGRRITDAETLDLVTMVYAGLINKRIVAALQALNCNAIGLTGADGNTLKTHKRYVTDIDYGFVGDVDTVSQNLDNLVKLLNAGFIPVFCAITHDGKGQLLNTNADTIASTLGVELSVKYVTAIHYCFEKKGVLQNVEDANSVLKSIDKSQYQNLKQNGTIYKGMIPKLDNAFTAIDNGVETVHICHANDVLAIINRHKELGTKLIC